MANMLTLYEKTIEDFLKSGVERPFLIPDYQRAYEWDVSKHIDPFFDDLTDFTINLSPEDRETKYFLGTIVLYVNKEKRQREIIDGQQRIVSLMMLLRAMHKILSEQAVSSDKTKNLLNMIEPTIWFKDDVEGTVDYKKHFISSESIDDKHKDDLRLILEKGTTAKRASGCYANNYKKLLDEYKKLYDDEQATAERLIRCLLRQTSIFLIEVDSRDTALTMFATLNNRGKPLSEVNIFRAEIYKCQPDEKKDHFNALWNRLFENIGNLFKMTTKDIFLQYMFYLLAKEGHVDSTVPGTGKYFTKEKSKRLRDKNILANLECIIKFWTAIKERKKIEGESWSEDIETLKIFDVLFSLSQLKTWRAAAVVYYLNNRTAPDFRENFRLFMRKLFSQYLPTCMIYSDKTFLRENLLRLNAAALKDSRPKFDFQRSIDINQLKTVMINSKYYRRILLLCVAYNHPEQTELLPTKFEVEHILPKKWQAIYSNQGYSEEKFSEYVEQLGNLTLIEPSLNKKLANSPFELKKKNYKQSTIAMTRALIDEPDNWKPDKITIRSDKLAESLINLWQKWSDDYDHQTF